MFRFGLILVVAGCSHHPPDFLVNRSIVNPLCITHCAADNRALVVKANGSAEVVGMHEAEGGVEPP